MHEPTASSTDSSATPGKGESHQLLRTMGLFSLVVYGVGDMIGSGIYGTVGKAAGQLGNFVWLAFVISMVAALLTGMSYACLASRYPRAAGAAYVAHKAFHWPLLSYIVGLTVTASGLTSMATSTNVFAENAQQLFGGPLLLYVLLFLAFMTVVNFRGIRESMWTNLLCTAVEVGGLLFIVAVGMRYWGSIDYFAQPTIKDATGAVVSEGLSLHALFAGSVLTFFAFVGFEDMLNIAEEVKEPRRNMPWGIVLALIAVTVLYISVAITAISVVDYHELAAASAPLSVIANRAAPWLPATAFNYITMFAVANTVLINYIMGSRLLYGMARQGFLPAVLGRVHSERRTPYVAILTLLGLVLILALSGGKERVTALASATGLLLLVSFMIVNSSLIMLKLRADEPAGGFEVPIFVPALGVLVNGILVVARLTEPNAGWQAPTIARAIILVTMILYFALHPKNITEESLAVLEQES